MDSQNFRKQPITIGLIIPSLYDSYQELILKGIAKKAKEINASVISYVGGGLNLERERHQVRNELYNLINPDIVDVFIILTGSLIITSGLDDILALNEKLKGKPAVSIGIDVPGMHNIVVNNDSGMTDLVEHLVVDHNCRKIAIITGPKVNEEAMERFNAYKKVLEKHNIPFDPEYVYYGSFQENDGIQGFKSFYDEKKLDFDAIIGADDWTTSFMLEYIQKRKIRVPEEFIVAGFDDTLESRFTTPPLTTVRQPIFQLGAQAVETAYDVVTKQIEPGTSLIPTHLVKRESCGCESHKIFTDLAEKKGCKPFMPLSELKRISDLCIDENEKKQFTAEFELLNGMLWKILQTIISALNNNSIKKMLKIIKDTQRAILIEEISISSWTEILSIIFGALSHHVKTEKERNKIAYYWSLALKTIYQEDSSQKLYENDLNEKWMSRIQRIGDRLTTTFELQEVLKILYDNMPLLNITSSAIIQFQRKKKQGKVIFSQINSKQVMPFNKKFEADVLHPDADFFEAGKSYVIFPLVTETEQFGFTIFNMERVDGKMYENLATKIATALKNVELIKKLNQYTSNLEKEVRKRTQQLERANKLLRMKSFKDPLSGLMNRRFLMEVILPEADLLLKAVYQQGENPKDRRDYEYTPCFGVYILDIDYFKKVNDTYGHLSGDMVIKQFSDILTKHSRKEDFIIRFGGEEFLVILKSFNKDYLKEKAEEIRRVVENFKFEIENGVTIHKTCSMGCIVYPVDTALPNKFSLITAINLADKGLYFAKEHGRNMAIQVRLNYKDKKFVSKAVEDIVNNFDDYVEQGYISLENTKDTIEEK